MDLPKTALDLLRTSLGRGEQQEIADELGMNQEYVCMQLNGNKTLRDDVYQLALKKIKNKKAKDKKAIKELTKLLA